MIQILRRFSFQITSRHIQSGDGIARKNLRIIPSVGTSFPQTASSGKHRKPDAWRPILKVGGNSFESNWNRAADRRMRYNRAKSETTMNGCCFADFVQLRKHSERKLFDRGELQPHLSKGGRSNKLNTTKAPVMYCYMEHQARSRTMTGAFSISRTWREK